MKKLYTIPIIGVSLFFAACSNPEEDALRLSQEFNSVLQGYKNCETPADFKELMSDASYQIMEEYSKCEDKYEKNEEKLSLFYTTYKNATDSIIEEYNDAYSDAIRSILESDFWYKPCIKEGYYVYTFKDDNFQIVGCKDGIDYEINVDTLVFDDDDQSRLVISFSGESEFSLLDVNSKESVVLEKADDRAKLCGIWSGKVDGWSVSYTIKSNGKASFSILGQTQSQRWDLNEDGVKFDNYNRDKYSFKNINSVNIGGVNLYRTTRNLPKSVAFLFDPDNQEAEPTKTSSNGGGQNWDKLLNEYEKLVDGYIKFYKKAQSGDMSAMSEYMEMLEKSQRIYEQLEDADDLSEAQVTRMAKIAAKMTSIY